MGNGRTAFDRAVAPPLSSKIAHCLTKASTSPGRPRRCRFASPEDSTLKCLDTVTGGILERLRIHPTRRSPNSTALATRELGSVKREGRRLRLHSGSYPATPNLGGQALTFGGKNCVGSKAFCTAGPRLGRGVKHLRGDEGRVAKDLHHVSRVGSRSDLHEVCTGARLRRTRRSILCS